MRSDETTVRIALALLLAVGPAAAHAQTRFEWPDTSVDVARYAGVDDCLAATQRIEAGLERADSLMVWRDTTLRDARAVLSAAPAPVTDAAVRCAARFTEAGVDLNDFGSFLTLFLAAGRDSDAALLVARRLTAVAANNARQRTSVADSAVQIYLDARPVRLAAAEAILVGRARGGANRFERLEIYEHLRTASHNAGDTARARRAARWILSVEDSLTPVERQSDDFAHLGGSGGQWLAYNALEELTGVEPLLDSLRRSTAALAAFERTLFARATGVRPDAIPFPTGLRAPVLTADYWLPNEAGHAPRPTPGRVSLVVFLDFRLCEGDVGDDLETSSGCIGTLAELRRLAHRFPTLEITVVSWTHGSFVYVSPPAPADEAELMRQFLDAYQVPNTALSVSTTPFWRLPQPDARRIENEIPNITQYKLTPLWKPGSGSMLLVDADGLIADTLHYREDELAQFIEVLVHRQRVGG